MWASILDLKYKMKNVLKALDHGKLKGVLTPVDTDQEQAKTGQKVQGHPFFGSDPEAKDRRYSRW